MGPRRPGERERQSSNENFAGEPPAVPPVSLELSVPGESVQAMDRAYTTLHAHADLEDDIRVALRWASAKGRPGDVVTLWCHDADDLPSDLRRAAGARSINVYSERPRPRGGRARNFLGPVVVTRVGLETLVQIEPFEHPVCLVHAYVPENAADGFGDDGLPYERAWIEAFLPECLAGPEIQVRHPLLMDPVVDRAMESFTTATHGGRTMYDSRDRGRVVHGLMELRRGGHRFDPEGLLAVALRAGWRGGDALELRSVAREINKGTNKQPGGHFREDILEHWRAEPATG